MSAIDPIADVKVDGHTFDMKMKPFWLLAILGLFGLVFWIGLLVGKGSVTSTAELLTEAEVAPNAELTGLEPQIEDAIHRWSLKSRESAESVRELYQPRSMFIPTRNQGEGMMCIKLDLKPGNLGGSPVYCYQDHFVKPDKTPKLVAEYSDVE